jgi:hypothetical protein
MVPVAVGLRLTLVDEDGVRAVKKLWKHLAKENGNSE